MNAQPLLIAVVGTYQPIGLPSQPTWGASSTENHAWLDIASQVMLTVQPQTAVTTISSAAVLW